MINIINGINVRENDVTGQKFGMLTAIMPIRRNGGRHKKSIIWLWKCDCGNAIERETTDIKSRHVISCGCWHKKQMSGTSDEVGQKYGKWTVLEYAGMDQKQNHMWLCKCDCGTIRKVRGTALRAGESKCCGCDSGSFGEIKNEVGNKYNHLTVIEYTGIGKDRCAQWLCQCDCGNTKIVSGVYLRKGTVRSCGCLSTGPKPMPEREAAFSDLYNNYKQNAKRRNLVWELSSELFRVIAKQPCFYCGKEPLQKYMTRRGDYFIYNGIDRYNNSIGYIDGNIVACCGQCNMAKRAYTIEEWYEWINRLHANLQKKDVWSQA
jgi:hypothetical protein